MATAAEARFREIEGLLDRALTQVRDDPAFADIAIRDLGGRGYHYKNQYLSWCHDFVRTREVDFEQQRVTVRLTFM